MATEDKAHVKADEEVTAGIELHIEGTSYTIKGLDTSKEISFSEIRGNNIKLEAAPETAIDYSGSLTFHGDKKSYFDDVLFDAEGLPKEFSITITHKNGKKSGYEQAKVTSEGYTADEGDATETSYDWFALDES